MSLDLTDEVLGEHQANGRLRKSEVGLQASVHARDESDVRFEGVDRSW